MTSTTIPSPQHPIFDPDVAEVVNITIDLPWPQEDLCQQSNDDSGVLDNHCHICLEDDISESAKIPTCGHTFCQPCLSNHCKHHSVLPIACPFAPRCEKHIPTSLVEQLVGPALASNYRKSYWMIHNKSLHECPSCNTLLSSPPPTADFRCGHCFEISCRQHGREHPNTPCSLWRNTSAALASKATDDMLAQWTKPCSHCGTRLQKSTGCNHVICPACKQDMCWTCGTDQHLTGKVVRHCHKCHGDYRDHRYDRQYRIRLCLVLPILLPFMIFYVAVATVIGLLSCCFCCCFSRGPCAGDAVPSGPATTVFVMLFPFVALLEDFGVRVSLLDSVFTDLRTEGQEIPVMDLSLTQSNSTSCDEEALSSETSSV